MDCCHGRVSAAFLGSLNNIQDLASGSFSRSCVNVGHLAGQLHHSKFIHATKKQPTARLAAVLRATPGGLENVRRIFAISDLHTDNVINREWLVDRCRNGAGDEERGQLATPAPGDVLLLAGDISHEMSRLKEDLSIILDGLGCEVFFVFGNHEAWVGGAEMDELGISSSLEKLDAVRALCDDLGVKTKHELVGSANEFPAWILPIEGWYDASLTIPHSEELCHGFEFWPWIDFKRCHWPDEYPTSEASYDARIPTGLAEYFINKNKGPISDIQKDLESRGEGAASQSIAAATVAPGLISFSHFLPNQQALPDWKDLTSETFLQDEWLDHGVPDISAKFAKVAGSDLIDQQIRSIVPPSLVWNSATERMQGKVSHIHVFGHSHRPKDFFYKNIRYVHNPLGKPRERDNGMVSPDVDFQLVWDTTLRGKGRPGEVQGEQIIRYWEEKGGGKKALLENAKGSLRGRREARMRNKTAGKKRMN